MQFLFFGIFSIRCHIWGLLRKNKKENSQEIGEILTALYKEVF